MMPLTDLELDLLRRPIPDDVLAAALARMDGLRPVIEARYRDGMRVTLAENREQAAQVRAALDELRGLILEREGGGEE